MSFNTVCFLHAVIIIVIIIFDVDLCGRINFRLDLKYVAIRHLWEQIYMTIISYLYHMSHMSI